MTGLSAMALSGGDVAFGFLPPHRPSRSGRRHVGAAVARTLARALRRGLRAIPAAGEGPVLPALRNYPY